MSSEFRPQIAMSSLFISKDTTALDAYRAIADSGADLAPMHHHGMKGDHIYEPEEIKKFASEVHGMGFTGEDAVAHLHGSHGYKSAWSTDESERIEKGLPVVKSRIDLAAELGGEGAVVTIHPMGLHGTPEEAQARYDAHRKTLDFMTEYGRQRGVIIAIENLHWPEFENHEMILKLLKDYGPDVLRVCIDTSHLNVQPAGLEFAEKVADRIGALHLSDNQGIADVATVAAASSADQHLQMYEGTFDWDKFARLLANNPYFSYKTGLKWVEIDTHEDYDRAKEIFS